MRVITFGVGRAKGRALLVIITFCLFIFFFYRSVHNFNDQIEKLQISSKIVPGVVELSDKAKLKVFSGQLAGAQVTTAGPKVEGRYKLTVSTKAGTRYYLFDTPGCLFEPRTGQLIILRDKGQCLQSLLRELEAKNSYGSFLPWDEVNSIFRKYDKAKVVDFETGMSFIVQRRAGSNHADVQPFSAEDSATMKTIYGGKWSWKRRAIVVEVNGHRIAGSMNGMPHGAGAISGNDFDGHFCIHFRDSKTHSNEENMSHQIMVWKAAGQFEENMADAAPKFIIKVMVVAMEQGDYKLASRLFAVTPNNSREKIVGQLEAVRWLAVSKIGGPKEDEVSQVKKKNREIQLVTSYGLKDGTQVKNRRLTFTLVKGRGPLSWEIDPRSLSQLTAGSNTGETMETQDDTAFQDWIVDMKM